MSKNNKLLHLETEFVGRNNEKVEVSFFNVLSEEAFDNLRLSLTVDGDGFTTDVFGTITVKKLRIVGYEE